MQVYADEAPENRGNRIYHNVVTKTRCGALTMREGVDDNRFVNNAFYLNEACAGGAPGRGAGETRRRGGCAGFRGQLRADIDGIL